jgi:gamma-glutamyl hercynylcysteine S-oxide synthase
MATQTAIALSQQLNRAREESDALFEVLAPGAIFERAVAERHRFLFYLGHLEAFDWNLLGGYHLKLKSPQPDWDQLFAFGIDPEANALPRDRPEDWPRETEVRAYCAALRDRIDEHIDALPPMLLHVAIEHRLMHLETLSYLLHNLPYQKKVGFDPEPDSAGSVPENHWVNIPAGNATLGQVAGEFGWDNEFPCHSVSVPAFRMQQHKVTNGEYLRFVEDGGPVPHFWKRTNGGWLLRCMFSEIELPLDWPAYVNFDQATRYAAWAGFRLPEEAEFHRAAYCKPDGGESAYPWGDTDPESSHGNFGLRNWNPMRVDAHPAGDSAFGVSQLVGNGWEWTRSPFLPFRGFEAFPFYPGYSADFFDHQHYVLKGGSPRTATALLRRSFRNWFRPEYSYAFASFRCVSEAV